ncbi:MAG: hypothetical protein C4K49_01330 [Candidatus Thorarchaeota archaeon]|nr:MAG: hypothetical protein C4K49_01330 [Candidatus Thorarchaeota archaeon]
MVASYGDFLAALACILVAFSLLFAFAALSTMPYSEAASIATFQMTVMALGLSAVACAILSNAYAGK